MGNANPDLSWQADAACAHDKTLTVDDWFPEGKFEKNSQDYQRHIDRLRTICHSCPVEALCLEMALENKEREGFWGGKTSAERRVILSPRWDKMVEAGEID